MATGFNGVKTAATTKATSFVKMTGNDAHYTNMGPKVSQKVSNRTSINSQQVPSWKRKSLNF